MANWTEEEKKMIWSKVDKDANNDPTLWRIDKCGAWMYWPH